MKTLTMASLFNNNVKYAIWINENRAFILIAKRTTVELRKTYVAMRK
jgi:hypothetical protein